MKLKICVFDTDQTRNEQYRHLLSRYEFLLPPIRVDIQTDWQHTEDILHGDLAIIHVGSDGHGFDYAEALQRIGSSALLLFIGGPEFAMQAFEYAPLDYLPLRFSSKQFDRSIQRLLSQRPYPAIYRPIDMRNLQEIGIRSGTSFHKVKIEDIRYVETLNRSLVFRLKDGKITARNIPLNYIESILCYSGFLRVHQSYIVRFDSIVCAELSDNKVNYQLFLDGVAEPIPVSRQKKDELLKMLYNQNLLII